MLGYRSAPLSQLYMALGNEQGYLSSTLIGRLNLRTHSVEDRPRNAQPRRPLAALPGSHRCIAFRRGGRPPLLARHLPRQCSVAGAYSAAPQPPETPEDPVCPRSRLPRTPGLENSGPVRSPRVLLQRWRAARTTRWLAASPV